LKKETKARVDILSILNQFEPPEAIALIESIGKGLRQANSIKSAKEVREFAIKRGLSKNINHYPINGELKNG
jgi:hypothetical protein